MKMKYIIGGIIGIIALVGIGYFISLHVSQEKPKTADDLQIQEILTQKEAAPEQKEEIAQDQGLSVIAKGAFNPDAPGSDALHRGWGDVSTVDFNGSNKVVFAENFKVTNGPDYMVYLVTGDVPETESAFEAGRDGFINIGRMRQFSGYQTFDIPSAIDPAEVTGVVVWCEQFGEFISSARLQ